MNTILKPRLVLLVLALLFTASVTRAQNGPSNPIISLSVFDSKGKPVGGVLGFGSDRDTQELYPVVAIKTGGVLFLIGVRPSGFVDEFYGAVGGHAEVYESTNCSGTPYSGDLSIASTSDNLFTAIDLISTKVFVADRLLPPKLITIQSLLSFSGCKLLPAQPGGPFQPVKMLVDLSTLYAPPFALK